MNGPKGSKWTVRDSGWSFNPKLDCLQDQNETAMKFPFPYKVDTIVSAIAFFVDKGYLNLCSNWMFFFKQIWKRIYW